MELTMQEKLKLIDYYEFLRDEEASKPLDEMNTELIDAYVKILLTLQDKYEELSPEFINEQVRKIFHSEDSTAPETVNANKKVLNRKKIWLVAACIAILVALFSIISFSSDRRVADILEDFFGSYEFIPFGKEVTLGNETYGKESNGKHYDSIEMLVEKEKISLLYPTNIKKPINTISLGDVGGNKKIDISYLESDLFIAITLNTELSQETIGVCDKKIALNGIKYYICIMEESSQAYFIHNNNLYIVAHSDEKVLMEILNSMEEIKYEN